VCARRVHVSERSHSTLTHTRTLVTAYLVVLAVCMANRRREAVLRVCTKSAVTHIAIIHKSHTDHAHAHNVSPRRTRADTCPCARAPRCRPHGTPPPVRATVSVLCVCHTHKAITLATADVTTYTHTQHKAPSAPCTAPMSARSARTHACVIALTRHTPRTSSMNSPRLNACSGCVTARTHAREHAHHTALVAYARDCTRIASRCRGVQSACSPSSATDAPRCTWVRIAHHTRLQCTTMHTHTPNTRTPSRTHHAPRSRRRRA
jgi:hypothetical protein